jgi:hypothetical protein
LLDAETRGRITRLVGNEADLTIESGELQASIVPEQGIAWTFHAGPYAVHVVGTKLGVRWNGDVERLDVWVTEGKVRVSGAHLARDGVAVAAGQRLIANYAAQEVSVSQGGPPAEEALDEVAPNEPVPLSELPTLDGEPLDDSAERPEPVPSTDSARSAVRAGPRAPAWKVRAEAGDYKDAMREARAVGFSQLIQSAPASDVMLLADAARLSGSAAEARQALTTLRERFAGQPGAALAAFRLGRLALDHGGNHTEAVRWMRTYLSESGGAGNLAEAARGRLMASLVQIGQKQAAQKVAREYLERHPSGQNAELAHSLVLGSKPE